MTIGLFILVLFLGLTTAFQVVIRLSHGVVPGYGRSLGVAAIVIAVGGLLFSIGQWCLIASGVQASNWPLFYAAEAVIGLITLAVLAGLSSRICGPVNGSRLQPGVAACVVVASLALDAVFMLLAGAMMWALNAGFSAIGLS